MSETTEHLRHKIDGATDLKSVVRTMKSIAGASIAQYEEAVRALSGYMHTVELGIAACLRHRDPAPEPPARPAPVGAVVFGTDQGLVGQFNEQLTAFVLGDAPPQKVWVIGERMGSQFEGASPSVQAVYPTPNSVNGITSLISRVLRDIEAARETSGIDTMLIYHHEPTLEGGYAPARHQLLPLDRDWQLRHARLRWPTTQIPEVIDQGPSPLAALLREYLFVSLYRACAESLASENASRLAAMQRAEKNISDMLDELGHQFNQVRQDAIDAELFDLVAGFEVLGR